MHLLQSCITLGLLFSLACGLIWEENDETIAFDGRTEGEEDEFEPIEESTTTGVLENSCKTSDGIVGRCIPLEECYPFYNFKDEDGETQGITDGLRELVNSSESCDSGSTNSSICCPSFGYASIRLKTTGIGRPSVSQIPVVNDTSTVAPTPGTATKVKPSCGSYQSYSGPSVVGGREVKPGEVPYAVAIMKGSRQFCGGSLVDENYVVTAAHCVVGIRQADVASMRLLIGAHNIHGGSHMSRSAAKIMYNKHYSGTTFRNDVALIKLDKPVTLSNTIQPVCLHNGSPATNDGKTNADVAGWGKTSEHGPQSQTLRSVNIRIWKNSECSEKYRKSPEQAPAITEEMVCAGNSLPGGLQDSCQGDSGGPLTVTLNGRAEQIGIVSWGIGCGRYPGVYARVDKQLAWINRNRT